MASDIHIMFTAVACTYVASSRHRCLIHHAARIDLATGAVFGLPPEILNSANDPPLAEVIVLGTSDTTDSLDVGLLAFLGALPDASAPIVTAVRPGRVELAAPMTFAVDRILNPQGDTCRLQVSEGEETWPILQAYIAGLPGPRARSEGAVLAFEIMRVAVSNSGLPHMPDRTPFWRPSDRGGWLQLTDLGDQALEAMAKIDRPATDALRAHFRDRLQVWSQTAVAQLLTPANQPDHRMAG